jgi:hypothetical protein
MCTIARLLRFPALGAAACMPLAACLWVYFAPDLLQALNTAGDYRAACADLESATRQGADADAQRARALARTEGKQRICRELVAGRLTLAAAARQAAALPPPTPEVAEALREADAGATAEERMCRHLVEWACAMLADHPEQAAAVRQRLEAELNRLYPS